MYRVHWIGYRSRVPCVSTYYTPYHAEQWANALRANGVPDVRVEGPLPLPAPTPYVVVARWRAPA